MATGAPVRFGSPCPCGPDYLSNVAAFLFPRLRCCTLAPACSRSSPRSSRLPALAPRRRPRRHARWPRSQGDVAPVPAGPVRSRRLGERARRPRAHPRGGNGARLARGDQRLPVSVLQAVARRDVRQDRPGVREDGQGPARLPELPADPHPQERAGRRRSRDVRRRAGKFWELHDSLFETQPRWAESKTPIVLFDSLARAGGRGAEGVATAA